MSKERDRYAHKFDWDKAKQLYNEGTPPTWIAKKFGVSVGAIRRVVIPGEMERMRNYALAYSKGKGTCAACGAPTNRVAQNNGSRLCKICANRGRITTVRETELKCSRCKQWKPDAQFHQSKRHAHRRGRRSYCKTCANRERSEFRLRSRIPCKGGCGRTVSISDQRARKRCASTEVSLGYCPYCSPTSPFTAQKGRQKILDGAAKFRGVFGVASAKAGTTEN